MEGYDVEWHAFDNGAGTSRPLAPATALPAERAAVPSDAGVEYLRARIRARGGPAGWRKAVDVYVRLGGLPVIVGIEREE